MPQRRTAPGYRQALALAAILCLSACYEEEDKTISQADSTTQAEVAADDAGAAGAPGQWLQVDDARDPAQFLAEVSGAPQAELSQRLVALAARYRESPRMIANRLLQLWQDHPEVPLPQMMADLLPRTPGDEHSLGPVAQQYRVLRDEGRSHAEAVARVIGAPQ